MKVHNSIRKLAIAAIREYRSRKKKVIKQNNSKKSKKEYEDFTILITTFEKRFFTYAVPLIGYLRTQTDADIVLIVNGNLQEPRDSVKLQELLVAVSRFKAVLPLVLNKFYGCSFMWNRGIQNSNSQNILVLNDDVIFLGDNFSNELATKLEKMNQYGVLTLNRSWSHFLITKQCIQEVGWFDERLLGIGQEDGDFAFRYEAIKGIAVPNQNFQSLVNVVDDSADDDVRKSDSKYSLYNQILIEHKYRDNLNGINGMYQSRKSKEIEEIELYPSTKWLDQSVVLLSLEKKEDIEAEIRKLLN